MDEKKDERKKVVVEEVPETPFSTEVLPETEVKTEEETTPTEPSSLEDSEEKPVEASDEKEPEFPVSESKEESQPETSTSDKKTNKHRNLIWIITAIVFIIAAFAGGIYVYQTGIKVSQPKETEGLDEFIENVFTPEPSPSATPDLTAFTVDIENGSGIAGEAGKAKTLLEEAGFKVGTAGNADRYDYTKTEISAKEEVSQDFLVELANILKENYEVDEPGILSASSSSDIIVIVGKTKSSTSTLTPAPTPTP
jgi:hypothetical protein